MKDSRRDLRGKIALVTGAAKRLGRHLALSLAEAGADIVLHYGKSQGDAEATATLIRQIGRSVWLVPCDLRQPDAVVAMMTTIGQGPGRLDIIINNVGNYVVKPIELSTATEWTESLQTNLIAPLLIIQGALPLFAGTEGWIINIGYAGLEHLTANVHSTAYQVSKTGLYLLTKSFAQRLAGRGIRVNMISPGHLENSVDLPKDVQNAIPIGRAGQLEDIADTLHFLIRRDSYITGINIDVAGGYRMALSDRFSLL